MIEALIEITAALGPACAIISAIVGCIALKRSESNTKALKDLDAKLSANDLAILRSKIKERADRCIDKSFVTEDELAELEGLYDCYRSLGGNSFIVTLMDKVLKLPIK